MPLPNSHAAACRACASTANTTRYTTRHIGGSDAECVARRGRCTWIATRPDVDLVAPAVTIARAFIVLTTLTLASAAVTAQPTAECATADECRQRTREAIAAGQFERAHDLAWLAFQKAPRQHAETMALLARAQSLSGRSDDAFVMLRRLAEAGVVVDDVIESDDFARVRTHPQWPQLLAMFEPIDEPAAVAPAKSAAEPRDEKPDAPPASAGPRVGDLAVPATVASPVAMAYDAVSARFVLGTASTDALTVLSQTSTNAAAFTSSGWSGGHATTAVAIDRGTGDLWVAARTTSGATLHRLQLISGRRLEAVEARGDNVEFSAIALAREGVFVLDRAGRRVLRHVPPGKALDVFASLPKDITPTGLAVSREALYVAHTAGVMRIDLTSRRHRPVTVANTSALANLHSLGWNNGVLMAVRQNGDQLSVVRARLNAGGTAVTRIEAVGPAASTAATLAGGLFYYVTSGNGASGTAVRAIPAK